MTKVVAIVQARMGSTRLPGKVLKKIGDHEAISLLIKRLELCKKIDEIIIATTTSESDDELCKYLKRINKKFVRGSEEDVLSRYCLAAELTNAEIIIRITGDCPFLDYELIDNLIYKFQENDYDYISNIDPPTFPDGLDVEILNLNALVTANKEATNLSDNEHVTPYIRNSKKFKKYNYSNDTDFSFLRLTLDEQNDLDVLNKVFFEMKGNSKFTFKDIISVFNKKPEVFNQNMNIKRNEGSTLNNGQKLYKKALNLIPGGTMLLSKNPDLFLPEKWPVYFSKTSGCKVWDLENKPYYDLSMMGVGTNILGYSNRDVDNAVKETIENGNMSTLNCPEEVELAEKLTEIHPYFQMAKFARSGGEANAVSIRIARAATGREKVAICGYHGWHDWYLSANLSSKSNLNEHLLEGLNTKGVPKALEGTNIPFSYNNIEQLKKIISDNKLAAIKMEVERNNPPKKNFLQEVRKLADDNGIVLIFDECTSGFRETFGGLHKKYDVIPDIAMFGKALGNGYAITATVGKDEVMKEADSTFISSTFWTERIGPTAALKTLEIMENQKTWEAITNKGRSVKKMWKEIATNNNLDINITGIDALPVMSFKDENALKLQTLLTQEMLKKGFLTGSALYLSMAHDEKIMNEYFEKLNDTFHFISKNFETDNIDQVLEVPAKKSSFSRLN